MSEVIVSFRFKTIYPVARENSVDGPRFSKEVADVDLECETQALEYPERRIALTAFTATEIGLMDLRAVGKLFLLETIFVPQRFQIPTRFARNSKQARGPRLCLTYWRSRSDVWCGR